LRHPALQHPALQHRPRQQRRDAVPLARPRDIGEIKLDHAFHELHRDIWHTLKAEVIKGYALTEGA